MKNELNTLIAELREKLLRVDGVPPDRFARALDALELARTQRNDLFDDRLDVEQYGPALDAQLAAVLTGDAPSQNDSLSTKD